MPTPPGAGSGRGGGNGYYSVRDLGPTVLADETKPAGPSPYQQALQEQVTRSPKKTAKRGGLNLPRAERTVNDLGTHTVNGVTAQGVRITTTIPAGSIGNNDAQIPVVTERWVSPDLKVLVKSVYSDPRFGTTTYELTNIQRTPPDPSLFLVPPSFQSRNAKGGDPGGTGQGLPRMVFKR